MGYEVDIKKHRQAFISQLVANGWKRHKPYTFTKGIATIEFSPVTLCAPDYMGLWLDFGGKRLGMGSDVFYAQRFPYLKFCGGEVFNCG